MVFRLAFGSLGLKAAAKQPKQPQQRMWLTSVVWMMHWTCRELAAVSRAPTSVTHYSYTLKLHRAWQHIRTKLRERVVTL